MVEKELHIMMGLPGSGKTTYVEEHSKDTYHVVSMDDLWWKGNKTNWAAECAADKLAVSNECWIDGLLCVESDVEAVIAKFVAVFNKRKMHSSLVLDDVRVSISIHQFECNRANCENNDTNRLVNGERQMNSRVSIHNMEYHELDADDIYKLKEVAYEASKQIDRLAYSVEYELLPVKKCGNWDLYFKRTPKHKDDKKDTLKSESWSLGGSWGDCWGHSGSITPDTPPTEFAELDELLLKLCPSLPILMYKKIYRDYVHIEEDSENDYYGGTEYRAWYEADMKGIYDYLRENNLIEE